MFLGWRDAGRSSEWVTVGGRVTSAASIQVRQLGHLSSPKLMTSLNAILGRGDMTRKRC